MRRRKALAIAIAAVLGALAVAGLPALAGAKDDNGHHRGERGHHQHHGVFDRDEDSGTISAFDATSGKLTIALFGGDSVSGLVTSRTDVRCGFGDDGSARFSRDSGNSGPGSGSGDDNGGRGEFEPGDDNGDRGEPEPGDDRGDHGNGRPCSTDDLTVGAVVHEADLDLEHGIARFDEIELDHSS